MWMKQGDAYRDDAATRLAGLGPAIADLNSHFVGTSPGMTWKIPLQEACSEVIENFAIGNFPGDIDEDIEFCPVLVEFKLKCKDQSVAQAAPIRASIWHQSDNSVRRVQICDCSSAFGSIQISRKLVFQVQAQVKVYGWEVRLRVMVSYRVRVGVAGANNVLVPEHANKK